MINKLYQSVVFIVSLLIFVAFFSWISGCSAIDKARDPDFDTGCLVIATQSKLGMFNQEGGVERCKLKCSKDLPKGFTYQYSNPRTGCSVGIINE